MTMTTAAFYIPNDNIVEKKVDEEASEKSRGMLLSALSNQHTEIQNFDLKKMCDNLTLQGKVEFVQRYATGALTKIINGEPITNKTMLDSLFNTYAPAFNATLEQTGYNSVMQMKDAAAHGTINVSTFLSGFSNGLSAIQEERDFLHRSQKYGEEIPIDLATKCDITYTLPIAEHFNTIGEDFMDYIKDFGSVKILVSAHVKNETADAWNINDYSNKLTDAMLKKDFVVFRIGNTIYEDVIITKYHPIIMNIYDISFDITIEYGYKYGRESRTNSNGDWVVNSRINDQKWKSYLSSVEYGGAGVVESLSSTDNIFLEQIQKIYNFDIDTL